MNKGLSWYSYGWALHVASKGQVGSIKNMWAKGSHSDYDAHGWGFMADKRHIYVQH